MIDATKQNRDIITVNIKYGTSIVGANKTIKVLPKTLPNRIEPKNVKEEIKPGVALYVIGVGFA